MLINNALLGKLCDDAAANPRLRQSLDLRTTSADQSQRMLNALMPGTVMPIHRHTTSAETCIVISGSMTEIFYDDEGNETERICLKAGGECCGVQIPAGQWHSLVCEEPCVLFEAKDGAYQPLEPIDIMTL